MLIVLRAVYNGNKIYAVRKLINHYRSFLKIINCGWSIYLLRKSYCHYRRTFSIKTFTLFSMQDDRRAYPN